MANLVTEARRMNYMDSSVEFLRGLLKFGKDKMKEMETIKDQVNDLKKEIIETHNDMVRKRKKTAGIDFRGEKFESLQCWTIEIRH